MGFFSGLTWSPAQSTHEMTVLMVCFPEPKGGSGGYGSGAAALQAKGGLFQGGVPRLRPVGAKDSSGMWRGLP